MTTSRHIAFICHGYRNFKVPISMANECYMSRCCHYHVIKLSNSFLICLMNYSYFPIVIHFSIQGAYLLLKDFQGSFLLLVDFSELLIAPASNQLLIRSHLCLIDAYIQNKKYLVYYICVNCNNNSCIIIRKYLIICITNLTSFHSSVLD